MGLESRDYVRDGSYTRSLAGWGIDFTPAVKYLVIANVVVFLLQIFVTRPAPSQMPPYVEDAIAKQKAVEDKARAAAEEAEQAGEKQKAGRARRREEEARKQREQIEDMSEYAADHGPTVSVVQQWLELDPKKTIGQGQLWRLLTCAFCHDRFSPWHIVFNMVLLVWFGSRLEHMYGSREFVLFYLSAAVCGSLAYVGLAYYSGQYNAAIGASGAVMGVMMLYTIFYPFETFYLFWFVPVPLWVLLGIYVVYDVHPVLLSLAGHRFFDGVAHAGHLGGLLFGLLYWKAGLRLESALGQRWSGTRRVPRRKAQPYREPVVLPYRDDEREALRSQVDEVLAKISRQGKDSLTEQERDLLIRASERYRDKK